MLPPNDSFKAFSLLYKINFMHLISKNDRCQMFFLELCVHCAADVVIYNNE